MQPQATTSRSCAKCGWLPLAAIKRADRSHPQVNRGQVPLHHGLQGGQPSIPQLLSHLTCFLVWRLRRYVYFFTTKHNTIHLTTTGWLTRTKQQATGGRNEDCEESRNSYLIFSAITCSNLGICRRFDSYSLIAAKHNKCRWRNTETWSLNTCWADEAFDCWIVISIVERCWKCTTGCSSFRGSQSPFDRMK